MDALLLESPGMQTLDVAKMKELRDTLGLTQTEAAARINMPVSRWCDIESGERTNVTVETLARVAQALECDARDLLTPAPKGEKPRKGRKTK